MWPTADGSGGAAANGNGPESPPARRVCLAARLPRLLFLLVVAFEMRLEQADALTLDLVDRRQAALDGPAEAEFRADRELLLHLVLQLVLPLEPGDAGL